MQLLDQILGFLRHGIDEIFKITKMVWSWALLQFNGVLDKGFVSLDLWKKLFLVVVAGVLIYLLYSSIKALLEAGQKALGAIATLLSVLIQTLLPVLLAGIVAAGAAYVVNNIDFGSPTEQSQSSQ